MCSVNAMIILGSAGKQPKTSYKNILENEAIYKMNALSEEACI